MNETRFLLFLILIFNPTRAKLEISIIDGLIKDLNRSIILSFFNCDKIEAFNTIKHFSNGTNQAIINQNLPPFLEYPLPSSFYIFILDFQCTYALNLLKIASSVALFAYPFKWIIFTNVIEIDIFLHLDVLVDSDVTLITKTNNEFSIKKIYKKHLKSTTFTIEPIGTFSQTSGLKLSYERIPSRRRKNLQRTQLNTAIVITHNDSLNHLTDKRDRHIDSIAKVDYVLVEHLKDTINATLNYTIKSTWGYKDKNSSWSGMIGQLTRKEADIGGTALFLTSDRIFIIDYIAMVTPTRSKFIFRQPKLSYVANVFILPFDKYVWASTCILLLIIAAVLFGIVKWEWKRQDLARNEQSNEADKLNSWKEVCFITFGALCQQGSAFTPFSIPGRIAMIFLFVSYMFLYVSYSANIVALLQSSSKSIKTLNDILHSRLDLGVDDTVFNHFYFPNATEPIRKAIYHEKVAPPGQKPHFFTIEDGIKRLRDGLFAFHVETGPGYKFISEIFREDEKCGLEEIQYLQVPDPWLAIQKNSSYKKLLKVGLRLLQENGVQNREVGLIYTRKPQCLSLGSSFVSVSLVDCYPAAVVLAGGIFAAIAILVLELYIVKRVNYWKKRIAIRKHNNINLTQHYLQ